MMTPDLPTASLLARDHDFDLVAAVDRTGGVYSTAPTATLSLLVRSEHGFEALRTATNDERSLVHLRAMRGSAHLVPRDRFPTVDAAMGPTMVARVRPNLRSAGIDEAMAEALGERALAALGDGPLSASQVPEALDLDAETVRHGVSSLLEWLCARGDVVRAGLGGTWRAARVSYARRDDWLPGLPRPRDVTAARAELVRWYLSAYGPATAEDVQWWTGWTVVDTADAIDAAGASNDAGMLAVGDTATAVPTGVRLLPVWDVLLVAWKDRARLLHGLDPSVVWSPQGNATATLLVDGRVSGVWDHDWDSRKRTLDVRVAWVDERRPTTADGLVAEVARLADLLGASAVTLTDVGDPPDLSTSRQNDFLRPLKDRAGVTTWRR